MPGWDVAGAFFVTALLLGICPGPDIIFVLAQSALYGARAGIWTTFGLATGLCVQTLIVALGVAVLFQLWPLAFFLLKVCGALWLCYLAFLAFRAKPDSMATGRRNDLPSHVALYRRGIIMNITNPKVSIFFLAFLPQFEDPARGSLALQTVVLGLLFILATLIVFCSVACLGGQLANLLNKTPQMQLWLNRVAGTVFLALAMALLFLDM